ncbi:TIGR00730 family Rossman fold protein [Rothia sp. AR01]|uniref:Cytokinin riboside 5'-monophosphate phosphoribohydrolase n=1 Tax=Rothia santali TaxID=2949643 RepID=A0A9X2HJ12_9MICC|nr:TIGR00730 family Rossman fold protein [Rothia santali]MCP3425763.1 TIGR00730 family Rossman fold protein [Rothia santali]
MHIAIYTGASLGLDPAWTDAARSLAGTLAEAGHTIVYGGGARGLMGVVADAALEAGGRVHGVIPQSLVDAEIGHPGLTELEVVSGMGPRKDRMAELADAMVALPGGAGTLEEFFEVWTAQMLGLHRKPVALYSPHGFWDALEELLDGLRDQGFLGEAAREGLITARTPEGLLARLAAWEPPRPRWG